MKKSDALDKKLIKLIEYKPGEVIEAEAFLESLVEALGNEYTKEYIKLRLKINGECAFGVLKPQTAKVSYWVYRNMKIKKPT